MTTTPQMNAISQFYRRLNHAAYGVTELVVIEPGKGIIATGFFDNEDSFVKACEAYNGKYNVYAGRNPRPVWLPKSCPNYLERRHKQRASDSDIVWMTAISLDIDPIRPKDTSSTREQHTTALRFAAGLRRTLGGWVDDSGNGAYLWFRFSTPIRLDDNNRDRVKRQCQQWQRQLVQTYQPERYGLRIDGCYDFSRIKKVIGTMSVKGDVHRLSRCLVEGSPSDTVRNQILSMSDIPGIPVAERTYPTIPVSSAPIPLAFLKLLRTNQAVQHHWCTPDERGDTSAHDWKLGRLCQEHGIQVPDHLLGILKHNPFGKFVRSGRRSYLRMTVGKLLTEGICTSGSKPGQNGVECHPQG